MRIDPTVWGWAFAADPGRAPEFLDAADVSCSGFGLSGSGVAAVQTTRCFGAGEEVRVLVDGTAAHTVKADGDGRVAVQVDLGPPHAFRQYTPQARAFEATGTYWASRTVRLLGESS